MKENAIVMKDEPHDCVKPVGPIAQHMDCLPGIQQSCTFACACCCAQCHNECRPTDSAQMGEVQNVVPAAGPSNSS
eukprot:8845812-Karenia_brevis.AAC.1